MEGNRTERLSDDDLSGRKNIERIIRDAIRRLVETGLEKITEGPESLRSFVADIKLPKEIGGYIFSQIDETKNALVRVVAREVREFLEATDIASELRKALTSLSFQINTEIRFVPNDAGTGVKPEVKSKVTPRRSTKPPPPDDLPPDDETH